MEKNKKEKIENEKNIQLSNLVLIKDFAKQLKKPAATIRTWKMRGQIPASCFLTIGATVFVKLDRFNDFVNGVA